MESKKFKFPFSRGGFRRDWDRFFPGRASGELLLIHAENLPKTNQDGPLGLGAKCTQEYASQLGTSRKSRGKPFGTHSAYVPIKDVQVLAAFFS